MASHYLDVRVHTIVGTPAVHIGRAGCLISISARARVERALARDIYTFLTTVVFAEKLFRLESAGRRSHFLPERSSNQKVLPAFVAAKYNQVEMLFGRVSLCVCRVCAHGITKFRAIIISATSSTRAASKSAFF